MNETLRVIGERYSCRSYDGRLPEREKLDAIALAAVQAPSAMNNQPWQVVVITDKALIDEMDADGMRALAASENKVLYERIMGRGGRLYYNAPCMFLILQKPDVELDIGIVSQNIALAAAAQGLGNLICRLANIPLNGPNGARFREKIGFPVGYEFGMAVLVGFAAEEGKPHVPDMEKIRFVEG